MIFVERTVAPTRKNETDFKYYFNVQNNRYNYGYGMPNCTAYALGRVLELGDLNDIDFSLLNTGTLGDGGEWGDYGYVGGTWTRSTTPKVGDVCVWTYPGGSGHVAIVEAVYPDGTIKTSNSAWDGADNVGNESSSRWWYIRDNQDYKNWGNYVFKYFLEPPYIDKPTHKIKKKGFPWYIINHKRFANRR